MKERRLWYFPCEGCGKRRAQSHKKKNATDGLCARCRIKPPEQNATLFDELETKEEEAAEPFVHKMIDTPPGHPMHKPIIVTQHMGAMMALKGLITIDQLEQAKSSEDGHLKGNFYLEKKIPICQ